MQSMQNGIAVVMAVILAVGMGLVGFGTFEQSDVVLEQVVAVEAVEEKEEQAQIPPPIPELETVSFDADAWMAVFTEIWSEVDSAEVVFENPDDYSLESFETLVYANLGGGLSVEVYRSVDSGDLWICVTLEGDEVPARKAAQYQEYYYQAVLASLVAQYEDITLGDLRAIETALREGHAALKEQEGTSKNDYFYEGDLYFSLYDEPEYNELSCYIGL